MNSKLEAALAYSRMHWRIFPCHSIVNNACSCGKPACGSPGKHPRTKAGFKEATDDEAQIRRWWSKWPDANIALATGSGIIAIDIDGEQGAKEFKTLVADHEAVPETLVAQTGRGFHLVFATRGGGPEVRSSARGNVHVRGEGGYIIVAPSNHVSGNEYRWIRKNLIAILPEWLRQWSQGYEIANKTTARPGLDTLGPVPAHLQKYQSNQPDIAGRLAEALKTVYSPTEQARLISALSSIPADNYETWFTVGMALQQLGWQTNDGDLGFTIWDEWSQLCAAKYSLGACELKWNSFGRSNRQGVTLGTVYHLARQHGWNPVPPPATQGAALNGTPNSQALPAAFLAASQAIFFPDLTEDGKPRPTMTNAKVAITGLGVDCRYDLFHNRYLVAGEIISKWNSNELSDPVISMMRDHVRYRWGFDPGTQQVRDAAEILCLGRRFDPVIDYLDRLQWDGAARLDTWLSRYMGAVATELTCAIGRLSLIAAVRRVRQPGTKFDQIIVLEGPQGAGKSEAIRILAGSENFSDQKILGVDDRKQQELTEGVWLYEIAELSGLRRAEIEHVKAFVSRTVDRARPAYGRYSVNQPRRTIFFGSTNQDIYLQDDTGNRRFWPVATSIINLEALARDRDQLWAEASLREARGESHVLPERLWKVADEVQSERLEVDAWHMDIANYIALKGLNDVSTRDVLVDNQFLQVAPSQVGRMEQMRAGNVLRRLGFVRYKKRIGEATENRYRRT